MTAAFRIKHIGAIVIIERINLVPSSGELGRTPGLVDADVADEVGRMRATVGVYTDGRGCDWK